MSSTRSLMDVLRKIFTGKKDEDIQIIRNGLEEVGVKEASDLQYLNRTILENITGLKTIDRSKLLNYIKNEYDEKYREMEQENEKDREHKVWHAEVEKKKSELEERIERCFQNHDDPKDSENTSKLSELKDFLASKLPSFPFGGNNPGGPKRNLNFLLLVPFAITILLDLSNAKNISPKFTLMIDIGFSALTGSYILTNYFNSNKSDFKQLSTEPHYMNHKMKLIILASGILAGYSANYFNYKQWTAIVVGLSTAAMATAIIKSSANSH